MKLSRRTKILLLAVLLPTLAYALSSTFGFSFIAYDGETCGSGEYKIWADLSELKIKKCVNGTVSDIGSGGDNANLAVRRLGAYAGGPEGSALGDTADTPGCFPNTFGFSITITACYCRSDTTTGTPTVMFQRDDGSAADILSAGLACDTTRDGASTTSFSGSENVIAAGDAVDCNVTTAGGTAKVINMWCDYTVP